LRSAIIGGRLSRSGLELFFFQAERNLSELLGCNWIRGNMICWYFKDNSPIFCFEV